MAWADFTVIIYIICKFLSIMMHTWSCVWDVCTCRVACIGPPDQLSNRSSYKNSISKAVVADAMDSFDFQSITQFRPSKSAVHGCPCLLQHNFAGIMFIVSGLDITMHKFCSSSSFFLLPVSTAN